MQKKDYLIIMMVAVISIICAVAENRIMERQLKENQICTKSIDEVVSIDVPEGYSGTPKYKEIVEDTELGVFERRISGIYERISDHDHDGKAYIEIAFDQNITIDDYDNLSCQFGTQIINGNQYILHKNKALCIADGQVICISIHDPVHQESIYEQLITLLEHTKILRDDI